MSERSTLLVVDDDPSLLETLQLTLEVDGHRVLTASNVADAIEVLEGDEVDVVVSDVVMPAASGMELLAAIRRSSREDQEVILISGHATVDTATEAIRRRAFDFLVKPVSGQDLRAAVGRALAQRRQRARDRRDRRADRSRIESLREQVAARGAELRASRERYQQLVETLPLAVFELDVESRELTYAGGSLVEAVPRLDHAGVAWLDVVHEEDRARVMDSLLGAAEGDGPSDGVRARFERAEDGHLHGEIVALRVTNDDPRRVGGLILDVTERVRLEETQKKLERELEAARETLERRLIAGLDLGASPARPRARSDESDVFFGDSQPMAATREMLELAAAHTEPVLLLGETGCGKGVLARWLHSVSPRAEKPLVSLNCSSLRGELLDSELFGHARGAFTSAVKDRPGLVEEADGGTLFLDEIGEMSLEVQAKLLKVLEEKEFRRLGETRVRRSDFRLVCATHRDLEEDAAQRRFRPDLLFRINVLTVRVPSLRERREDIPPLARALLSELGVTTPIGPDVERLLTEHDWPGNVRELRNALIRATLLARGGDLAAEH